MSVFSLFYVINFLSGSNRQELNTKGKIVKICASFQLSLLYISIAYYMSNWQGGGSDII